MRFHKFPFLVPKGFTLLEVIVAVTVISVGIVGSMLLVNKSISAASISGSRLIAFNLAQEGIEVVRNIRDSNWLAMKNWNEGLAAGGYELEFNTTTLSDTYDGDWLRINPTTGLYNYTQGTPSPFKRKVTISNLPDGAMEVVAEVTWQEHKRNHSFSLKEYLYDWR